MARAYGTMTVSEITDIIDVYFEYSLAVSSATVTNSYAFNQVGELGWTVNGQSRKVPPTWVEGYRVWVREVKIKANVSEKIYGTPYPDTAVNEISNNLVEYLDSQGLTLDILNSKVRYMWRNLRNHTRTVDGWTKPDYPAGTYAASGKYNSISGTYAIDYEDSSTYGFNTYLSNTALNLRYDNINMTTLSTSDLTFYYPKQVNGAYVQGESGLKLSSNGLILYNRGDGTEASRTAATLNTTGLVLSNGGIIAGDYTTEPSKFIYLSTEDYSSSPTITINGNSTGWRQIIGNKFGVKNDGTLYATNADISGKITVGSGSNVYTTDGVNPLEIGGTNLFGRGSDLQTTLVGLNTQSYGFSITTEDGVKCAHATGALTTTKFLQSKLSYTPRPMETFTFSGFVKIKNIVRGTTNPMCEVYFSGVTIDGAWRGFAIDAIYLDGVKTGSFDPGFDKFIADTNWHHFAVVAHFNYSGTSTISALTSAIYLRDCTGDLYLHHIKLERGNKATDWSPAETTSTYVTEIDGDGIFISPANQSPTTSAAGNSVRIDGNGMKVYKSGVAIAQYGASAIIGSESAAHSVIDADGQRFYASGNTQLANIGYAPGTAESGTATAPYYDFGIRASGTTKGNYSVAEGINTTASGFCSHAEGSQTIASGHGSHAEGSKTIASGHRSHAEGGEVGYNGVTYYSTASGNYSHAEGGATLASGSSSHAEGEFTTASGEGSHAGGRSTTASGLYSFAHGHGLIAQRARQFVIGSFNIADTAGSDATAQGDYAFIIGGGGTDQTRKNLFTVDWFGNVNIAVSTGKYKINGTNLAASDVGAVPTSRTVNGKALSSNITLSASDVSAVALSDVTDSGAAGKIPKIKSDGVLEIRKYIDMHDTNSSLDYDVRLTVTTSGTAGTGTLNIGAGNFTWNGNVVLTNTTTTATPSITTSTGTLVASSIARSGKLRTLFLRVKNSSTISAGSNVYVGTLSTTSDRPAVWANGVGYYGSAGIMFQLKDTGEITGRVIGAQLAANGEVYASLTYVVS